MRPLVIDDAVRADIKRVVAYAEAHRVPLPEMRLHADGKLPPPGDDNRFVCVLPRGFRCVYTVEYHPSGLYRHLSVSVPDPGRAPNETAVILIASEFGFHPEGIAGWVFRKEDFGPDRIAINVLERYE